MTVLAKITEPSIQTTTILDDEKMNTLQAAATNQNETAFLTVYRQIDWHQRPPEDFMRAIRLAFMAGAHTAARHLATEGAERFPQHVELQRMASVLAPPKATVVNGKMATTWRSDREWLKMHWDEYRGKWVALNNGQLVAWAESAQGLYEQVGDTKGTDILITPIW